MIFQHCLCVLYSRESFKFSIFIKSEDLHEMNHCDSITMLRLQNHVVRGYNTDIYQDRHMFLNHDVFSVFSIRLYLSLILSPIAYIHQLSRNIFSDILKIFLFQKDEFHVNQICYLYNV